MSNHRYTASVGGLELWVDALSLIHALNLSWLLALSKRVNGGSICVQPNASTFGSTVVERANLLIAPHSMVIGLRVRGYQVVTLSHLSSRSNVLSLFDLEHLRSWYGSLGPPSFR